MKKILASLFAFCLLIPATYGQDDEIRQPGLGISFSLTDFVTAYNIRSTSLSHVLSNNQIATLSQMSPGIALTYFKGFTKHLDFAVSLGASSVYYPFTSDNNLTTGDFLLTADAQVNFKLTTEKYWVQPYITTGVGANEYGGYYGAYIPMGLGLKVNFSHEAQLFISSQYRVPVTIETSAYHFFYSLGIAGTLGKKKVK